MKLLYFFFVLLSTLPHSAFAEFVGISKEDFMPHHRSQKDPLWCWAASAEMVLSSEGIKVPQESIVHRVKGALVGQAGNPAEMINSTNGVFIIDGKKNVVSGQLVLGAPLSTVLYNQLKEKRPVILTYQASPQFGHAAVLTGIDAQVTPAGVMITKFYVFDPFPYRMMTNAWGGVNYVTDESLIYKEYAPQATPFGIAIPAGLVTGMILINGS